MFFLFFQKKFRNRVIKNVPDRKPKNKKKETTEESAAVEESEGERQTRLLVLRHSGVLGLCAFVDAAPYDVPEFMPDVLMFLSDLLHAPQPIPVSGYMPFFRHPKRQTQKPLDILFTSSIMPAVAVSTNLYASL